MHLDSWDPPDPSAPSTPQIDDLANALESHPRWAGLVFRAERWQVAGAIWALTERPVAEHAPALQELARTLAPYDPSALDPLCAAYRRAVLRWGGTRQAS